MLISTWYRLPSANIEFFYFFDDFLRKTDNENKEIVITGDFNCNLLATEKNDHTTKLDDLITEYQLQQKIKDPTRITPKTKTLSDIILIKMDNTKIIVSGVIHLGISSDHCLVYLCRKVSIPKSKPKIVKTRQFKYFDSQHFQYDLSHAFELMQLNNCNNANDAWNAWRGIFLEIADYHAPLKRRKIKSEYNS